MPKKAKVADDVKTAHDDAEDVNFVNSRIQKVDFFMFRIKDYITKECKKHQPVANLDKLCQ